MLNRTLVAALVLLTLSLTACAESAAGDADADAPHVVFIIAEREFNTRETLPAFAAEHLDPHGFRTTFIEPADDPNSFPGLIEALGGADLAVLSVRRRALPEDQMRAFRGYLDAGGPLVGIRTASHAFGPHDIPEGHTEWPDFDVEVLGGDYQMHYGNKGEPPTVVRPAGDAALAHPILADWDADELHSQWHLYRNRDLADDATLLLTGHVQGRADETTEALAWTHTYRGGRIFYTSLGGPDDFELEAFQHLLRNAILWALEPNDE